MNEQAIAALATARERVGAAMRSGTPTEWRRLRAGMAEAIEIIARLEDELRVQASEASASRYDSIEGVRPPHVCDVSDEHAHADGLAEEVSDGRSG